MNYIMTAVTRLFCERFKYIAAVLIMDTVYISLYRDFGFTAQFIGYVLLSTILTAAAIKDIQSRTIPDRLIVFGTAAGITMIFFNPGISLISSLLGALSAGGVLWIISLITKGGVGMGDVKLFACVGIFLGVQGTLGAMLVSTILSGLAGLVMILFRVSDRKGTMPFAPFIFVGTVLVILLG